VDLHSGDSLAIVPDVPGIPTTTVGSERISHMKLAQHGALLFMMRSHAAQNVVKDLYGGHDVGAVIEHDALGAFPHSSIGDLRTGGNAIFRERFGNLGHPDHRRMRGVTKLRPVNDGLMESCG
jgi:hypothetical protein